MTSVLERSLPEAEQADLDAPAAAASATSRPMLAYGRWLHGLVCRRGDREMYLGTMFLRNRPALELMRRLIETKSPRLDREDRGAGLQYRRGGVLDSLDPPS